MEPLCLLRLVVHITCITSFASSPSFFVSQKKNKKKKNIYWYLGADSFPPNTSCNHRATVASDFHPHSSIQSTWSLFYKPACWIFSHYKSYQSLYRAPAIRPKPCHVDAIEMTALWMNTNQCGFIHWLHPLLYYLLFSYSSRLSVYVWTFLILAPFKPEAQTPSDEWKIKWSLLSFAVYHHVLFYSPSCCFKPNSPLFCFTFIYPSVASAKHLHLPLEIHSLPPLSCILLLPFLLLSSTFFPSLHLSHLSILPSLSVLWWGAGWPWIPLLLWGNNRHSLLLSVPLSPTWGPHSTGKEGARKRENMSGVWEKGRRMRERYEGNKRGHPQQNNKI